MKIADILSSAQFTAMYDVANTQSDADKHAPELSLIHEFLYAFAAQRSCVYSAGFWRDLHEEHSSSADVMVWIKNRKATIMPVMRTRVFAHHLGEMLKEGVSVCWIVKGRAKQVDWENWKVVYAQLTADTTVKCEYDEQISRREMHRIRVNEKRERMFSDAALSERYKKMSKRGYNLAFDEMRAMQRQEEYERKLRKVVNEAEKIWQVL